MSELTGLDALRIIEDTLDGPEGQHGRKAYLRGCVCGGCRARLALRTALGLPQADPADDEGEW